LTSSVVYSGIEYADAPPEAPECRELVIYSRDCGHTMHNVPCALAFKYAAEEVKEPPCEVLIEVESPLCSHTIKIPCYLTDVLSTWQPWDEAPEMTTTFIASDGKFRTKLNVRSDGQKAHPPPTEALAKYLKCGQMAELIHRGCNHISEVSCASLIFDNPQNASCSVMIPHACSECGHEEQYSCSQLQSAIPPCKNKVYKECTLCRITRCEVECCVESVKCHELVEVTLACKHKVSFRCGTDEDPRSSGEPCLSCTLEQWKNALSRSTDRLERLKQRTRDQKGAQLAAAAEARQGGVKAVDNNTSQLRERLWDRLRSSLLPEEWIIREEQPEDFDINSFAIALHEILDNYTKQLHNAVENDDAEDLMLVPPPDLSDPEVYDLVFGDSFRPTPTLFGSGIRVLLLSEQTLRDDCKPDEDGCVTVNVAAALRFRPMMKGKPFRKKDSDIKGNVKGKKEKEKALKVAQKRADEMRKNRVEAGYDYVIPPNKVRRIYWTHSSVIAIGKLKIQIRRDCMICCCPFPRAEGCLCLSDHFVCWSCLQEHARHALQPDALASNTSEGRLTCPEPQCDQTYKIEDVALQLNAQAVDTKTGSALLKALYDIKREADINKVLPEALKEQEERLNAEHARLMNMNESERKVAQVRSEIIEDVLTLRCPKCRVAFDDFEGCFSLTCSNRACQIQFCAWCLDHYDELDCHSHVATCPHASKPGYFHSKEIFRTHHQKRQKRKIVERLKHEKEDGRKILLALQNDLRDLSITISETEI